MASLDSQGEIVLLELPNPEETQICEGGNMWKWTGTFPPTFTFAASACLYCRLYLTNAVDATVMVCLTSQKHPKSWDIFDNAGRVLSETAVNGPENSRPGVLGPQITKFWWENCCIFQDLYGCLFVRGILPVSVPVPVNFLSLNFCIWSVWPVNHWLFMYWMIVKCCLTNTSIVCYLYLFKESFPYNSG